MRHAAVHLPGTRLWECVLTTINGEDWHPELLMPKTTRTSGQRLEKGICVHKPITMARRQVTMKRFACTIEEVEVLISMNAGKQRKQGEGMGRVSALVSGVVRAFIAANNRTELCRRDEG